MLVEFPYQVPVPFLARNDAQRGEAGGGVMKTHAVTLAHPGRSDVSDFRRSRVCFTRTIPAGSRHPRVATPNRKGFGLLGGGGGPKVLRDINI